MWAQMQAQMREHVQLETTLLKVHMHMQAQPQAQEQEQMQTQMQPLLENGQRARSVEGPCGRSDNPATASFASSRLPCLRDVLGGISSRSRSASSSASDIIPASPHAKVTSRQAADLMLHFSTLASKISCKDNCNTSSCISSPHSAVVSSGKRSFPSLVRVNELG
jgi:hypothetical protein